MTDYYKMKHNACIDITELIKKGRSEDEIIFKIESKYGLGAKMVKARIALVQRVAEEELKRAESAK